MAVGALRAIQIQQRTEFDADAKDSDRGESVAVRDFEVLSRSATQNGNGSNQGAHQEESSRSPRACRKYSRIVMGSNPTLLPVSAIFGSACCIAGTLIARCSKLPVVRCSQERPGYAPVGCAVCELRCECDLRLCGATGLKDFHLNLLLRVIPRGGRRGGEQLCWAAWPADFWRCERPIPP